MKKKKISEDGSKELTLIVNKTQMRINKKVNKMKEVDKKVSKINQMMLSFLQVMKNRKKTKTKVKTKNKDKNNRLKTKMNKKQSLRKNKNKNRSNLKALLRQKERI